jgi:hypothetical protein
MANENDLIRRGDLKELLLKRSFFPAIVAAALKEIPKVDAVDVIRCKDCKAYDKEGYYCEAMGFTCEADDFCSYGERKDNGNCKAAD